MVWWGVVWCDKCGVWRDVVWYGVIGVVCGVV